VNAFSFLPTVRAPGYRNYLQFVVGMEKYTAGDITIPGRNQDSFGTIMFTVFLG